MLDVLIEKAKKWFEENSKECPKYARDWVKTGINIPPGMSRSTLKSKGLKPADIINGIYNNEVAQTNSKAQISLDNIGLQFLNKTRNSKNHYNYIVKCLNCNTIQSIEYGLLVRWSIAGYKYCSLCRNSSGKSKPIEFYSDLVPSTYKVLEKVLDSKETLLIHHSVCDKTFTRTISGLVNRETEELSCPYCSDLFIKNKVGSFDSLIEKELYDLLIKLVPRADIILHQPYSKLIPTLDRKFIADFYLPKYNLVIEVSTKSNNLPNYKDRLLEKEVLCKNNGINFAFVTSKTQLEDIVQKYSS